MTFTVIKQFVPERKTFIFVTLLAVMILAISGFYPASSVAAKYSTASLPPESFSNLAEEVSPAVVNIRTVKTIKGGGRVFRQFTKGPFGEDDPMRVFFDRFFDEDQMRYFTQRSLGS
mgnify:FL=1